MLLQWHWEDLLRAGKREGGEPGVEMEAGASLLSERVSSSDSCSLTPAGSDELRETAPQGPGHPSGAAKSDFGDAMSCRARSACVEHSHRLVHLAMTLQKYVEYLSFGLRI